VAKKARLIRWAFTDIAGHPIMTGTPIKTRLDGAVVHIDLTIVALEPVDTDTRVTTLRVVTRGSILAYVRPGQALIHVLVTIFSFEFGRAFASVSLYSVNATASVLAKMAITVVYVDMASGALKALRTRTLVVVSVDFATKTAIFTRVRPAGFVNALAMFACVAFLTDALVRSVTVNASASIQTRIA